MIDHGSKCAGDPCTCGARKTTGEANRAVDPKLHELWIANKPTGLLLSPDCRDGNHGKCDGVAWDLEGDKPSNCNCATSSLHIKEHL